ncbi:metallopeptidase TldD-related protein [Brevibacillus sp. NRS-1366]|uniref:metallopeptidase TldD-related protein n=1 Tax=Brevibacillus sp. NRS-1366 TaxID=3233899 RepID=UPI003D263D03
MGNQQVSTETCSICFETEIINSSDSVQSPFKSVNKINTIRLVNDGRLGVAVSTGSFNSDLVAFATDYSKFGPKVPNDFLRFPKPCRQNNTSDSDRELLFRLWLNNVNNFFNRNVYEYKYIIRKIKRTLQLAVDEDQFLYSEHLHIECIFRLRYESGSHEMIIKKSCMNHFPDPLEWFNVQPWRFETYHKVRIESGIYEVVFAPEAFQILLDMLLHNFSAQMYPVKDLLITKESIGEKVFSSELYIEHSSGSEIDFDDEGTPFSKQPLVQEGILNGYYNDRFLSVRQEVNTSGNGFRCLTPDFELKEGIPSPRYPFAKVKCGNHDLMNVIENMRNGIIIEELSRSHNSDFLISFAHIPIHKAFYVKNGKVVGELCGHPILFCILKDLFANITIASDRSYYIGGRTLPWVYAQTHIMTRF